MLGTLTAGVGSRAGSSPLPSGPHPSGHSCVNTPAPAKAALVTANVLEELLHTCVLERFVDVATCPALVAFASGGRRNPVGVRTRWRGGSGWLARGERIEPWPINEAHCFRSGMPQPRDPARASSAPRQTKKTTDPARRPRPPQGPVAAREWDVAHAAALRALLTQPPAVLPNQVGDPLLPLQIGIWDALWRCCGLGLSRRR